jgi:hypothetical protein
MALIDVELSAARFQDLVQLLAAAGPIPVGTAAGLGAGRLISAITWDSVNAGPAPPGFAAPPGAVTARANITLRHVSIADLDANPNPTGAATAASAFLLISADTRRIHVQLLTIEVGGTVSSFLASPISLANRNLPPLEGVGPLAGAAILFSSGIATIRLATSPADTLLAPPLNVLSATGTDWAIRVSGGFFADRLLAALRAGVSPPPAGTIVEDRPEAWWTSSSSFVGATGSVGLEKPEACWGIIDDTAMSVTVNAVMTLAPNPAATPPQLVLNLTLSSDASDWDSFRCWLGSGGLGSIFLGAFVGPIVGIVAGVVSLVGISEIVRLDAGEAVTGAATPAHFTLVDSTDTSATYTASMNLVTLEGLGMGSTTAATVGPVGLVVSGSLNILPCVHDVAFTPPGNELSARFVQTFNCKSDRWVKSVRIPLIQVTDSARILSVALGSVPVTVFPTSRVTPTDRWSLDFISPAPIDQYVEIVGSAAVQPGDQARVYLHTSAGIRRYDTAEIAEIQPPTPIEDLVARARCLKFERYFTPREEIRWLIDPPGLDYGHPPLRQWQFTFANLPAGVRLSFLRIPPNGHAEELLSVVTSRGGEAAFEFIGDADSEMQLRHDHERLERGRVRQRWLLPTRVLAAGRRPTGLIRAGSKLGVVSSEALLTFDLHTGRVERKIGRFDLSKQPEGGVLASETKSFLLGGSEFAHVVPRPQTPSRPGGDRVAAPFSITLPGNLVAALHDERLIIAVPYGEATVATNP